MNFLNLLVEHWHIIVGLALFVGAVVFCVSANINFNRWDGPNRK